MSHATRGFWMLAALCILAGAMALALAVGALHAPPTKAAPPTPPPWLAERTGQLLADCGDPSPVSVDWALTSGDKAVRASQEGAQGSPTTALYVVVAHGDFTYRAAKLPANDVALPTGHTIVVVFDPATGIMTDFSLLVDDLPVETSLGTTVPLAVEIPSP